MSNTSNREHSTHNLRRLAKNGMLVEYVLIAFLMGLAVFQVVFVLGTKTL
jgi:hypothetical protein